MTHQQFTTRMIYVLLAWCAALAIQNAWQAWQIQDLLAMIQELKAR